MVCACSQSVNGTAFEFRVEPFLFSATACQVVPAMAEFALRRLVHADWQGTQSIRVPTMCIVACLTASCEDCAIHACPASAPHVRPKVTETVSNNIVTQLLERLQ